MIKRSIDLLVSLFAGLILFPIIILVAIAVRINLGSPVLFCQPRAGLNGQRFMMYKFRTMTDERAADGSVLQDELRLTPFGHWLRATSLDELPGLWNVIIGDMSLVGPRPLLMDYLPRYSDTQMRRHEVRPGITGWAQINGRNTLSWPERLALDVWYVDNQSLLLDIKILFLTIAKVVKREGIQAENHVTMPEFKGEQEYNILVLSAGRRVELIEAFQDGMTSLGINGCVIAADMLPEWSSACYIADRTFSLPAVNDENYISALLTLCQQNSVHLIIPTIDTELPILSDNVDSFLRSGIEILVSTSEIIALCRDKRKTGQLFELMGIKYPTVYDKTSLEFPLFCKPYDGSSSVGAFRIENKTALTKTIYNDPKNMFMALIDQEHDEITVDAYFNRQGRCLSLVPRQRISVRSGEVNKALTLKGELYQQLRQSISVVPGMRGVITLQFFYCSQRRSLWGLEINPRFGGGYPLTHEVGAQYTHWLLREYIQGENLSDPFDDWEAGVKMLRYDAKVIIREKSENV